MVHALTRARQRYSTQMLSLTVLFWHHSQTFDGIIRGTIEIIQMHRNVSRVCIHKWMRLLPYNTHRAVFHLWCLTFGIYLGQLDSCNI